MIGSGVHMIVHCWSHHQDQGTLLLSTAGHRQLMQIDGRMTFTNGGGVVQHTHGKVPGVIVLNNILINTHIANIFTRIDTEQVKLQILHHPIRPRQREVLVVTQDFLLLNLELVTIELRDGGWTDHVFQGENGGKKKNVNYMTDL